MHIVNPHVLLEMHETRAAGLRDAATRHRRTRPSRRWRTPEWWARLRGRQPAVARREPVLW